MKTLTLAQARQHFIGKWEIERLDQAEKTYNEVKAFIPTVTLSIKVRNEDDKLSNDIESIDIAIQTAPFVITVSWFNQYKKYLVHSEGFYGLKNVDIHAVRYAQENINEPVRMGKLSLKKLNDWIDYHNAVYTKLVEKNNDTATEIAEFRKELAEAQKAGVTVKYWNADIQGYIERGGLRFEFTILNTGIERKTTLTTYQSDSLDTFLKLSDNKYTK